MIRYSLFQMKQLLLMIVGYVVSLLSFEVLRRTLFEEYLLSDLTVSTDIYWVWMVSVLLINLDISNNMISRQILNNISRRVIWVSKALVNVVLIACIAAVKMTVIGIVEGTSSVLRMGSPLATLFLLSIAVFSLVSISIMLINSVPTAAIIVFVYSNTWTYAMMEAACENSKSWFVKKNPLFLVLKFYNTGRIEWGYYVITCLFFVVIWIVSFFLFERKSLR